MPNMNTGTYKDFVLKLLRISYVLIKCLKCIAKMHKNCISGFCES